MDFEKAYQKFLDGTATPEEIEFVRAEINRANEVSEVLSSGKKEVVTSPAEEGAIKKAIKKYWRKDTLKILVIVACSIFAVMIAVGLAIGIPVLSSAKDNTNYSKAQAKAIAVERIVQQYPDRANEIEVYKVEKELEVEGRIKNARYIFVVEVYNGDKVVEVEIDGKTGRILDMD